MPRGSRSVEIEALGAHRSRVTYVHSFRARPALLAPVLEPIMHAGLRREVRARLRGLRDHMELPVSA